MNAYVFKTLHKHYLKIDKIRFYKKKYGPQTITSTNKFAQVGASRNHS